MPIKNFVRVPADLTPKDLETLELICSVNHVARATFIRFALVKVIRSHKLTKEIISQIEESLQ